ncbi:NAD-dependent epimerase/dehydratase family protein [Duganella sp. FT135W]|uniref:NAD-dependent epimerase/dehydratase family protein n=1 Tax=Duganella flavida TaxID=2692175 RepID=A0A6L8KFG3_9BURK|nr:NAD(P)-dependent oxidoreductase [Duganella flavida]MYM25437.1 NAD-dependent epimerase/dehydratase family protein [Duganella flavida]
MSTPAQPAGSIAAAAVPRPPFSGSIALLGASSAIARDLVLSLAATGTARLQLYVRDLAASERWLSQHGLQGRCALYRYEQYGSQPHDAVINFVGAGAPQRVAEMGAAIFEVTRQHDDMVLAGLRHHPERRYIFLSSGAVYGHSFQQPAGPATLATFPVNALGAADFYAIAKLVAECGHRALPQLDITDLRVFNYFGRNQDVSGRFFICDILRAVRDGATLRTTADAMRRDYLHPQDFYQMIECVLAAPPGNRVLDCYTQAPVDKLELLQAMQARFGLSYEVAGVPAGAQAAVNATGAKPHYYSLRRDAAALGYAPAWSSLTGVLAEAEALLNRVVPA